MSFSSNNPGLQNQIPLSVELSKEPSELRNEVNSIYQSIASSLNNKIGGLYVPIEKINSEQYFIANDTQRLRQVYRMTVDFGALPNSTSKSVAHNIPGINGNYRLTSSRGGSTDPNAISWLPIPNEGILLEINSTSVNITTTSDRSAYTETTVVIEFTKEA